VNGDLVQQVFNLSGQRIGLCYHCHKCTAGCPVVGAMDFGPDLLLRMAALGQTDAVLSSRDLWMCAGCYACATRCPNGIDVPAIMDGLRHLALTGRYTPGEPDVLLFHRLFLGTVQRFGRSHEAFLLGLFKVQSHIPLWNDVPAGIGLFLRGKVPLLPERLRAPREVTQAFQRSRK
jgi:heterodisulfide reductase subunit C